MLGNGGIRSGSVSILATHPFNHLYICTSMHTYLHIQAMLQQKRKLWARMGQDCHPISPGLTIPCIFMANRASFKFPIDARRSECHGSFMVIRHEPHQ